MKLNRLKKFSVTTLGVVIAERRRLSLSYSVLFKLALGAVTRVKLPPVRLLSRWLWGDGHSIEPGIEKIVQLLSSNRLGDGNEIGCTGIAVLVALVVGA